MAHHTSINPAQGQLYPEIALGAVYTGIGSQSSGKTVSFNSSQAEFRRPVKTMVIRPVLGAMTVNGRKLFIAMLGVSHRQIKEMQQQGKEMLSTEFFSCDYLDMVAMITNNEGRQAEVLKKSISELQSIVINVTAPEDGEIWNRMPLVGQAKLIRKNGGRVLQWSLAPDMVAILRDSAIFQSYDTRNIANLSSYSSLALYDICVRYSNIGTTCINNTEWWISALMTECRAKGKNKKVEPKTLDWRKFKHRFVKNAISEINEHTDIVIELFESKTGLKITDLQFKVRKKAQASAKVLSLIPKELQPALLKAKALSVAEKDILTQYKKGYGPIEIELALAKLKSRLEDFTQPGVTNIGAYLVSIFSEIATAPIELSSAKLSEGERISTPLSAAELITIPAVKKSIAMEAVTLEQKFTDAQMTQALVILKKKLVEMGLYAGSIKEQFDQGVFKGALRHYLAEALEKTKVES